MQNSSYTDGKPMIYDRVGSGTGLIGTWIGTAHLNDAGKEIYTLTVGADGSVAWPKMSTRKKCNIATHWTAQSFRTR